MLLTDPEFIRRLELMAILARKVLNGELKADRKSNKKGCGTIFADYQEYNIGDDLRNIDWNIAARLEQFVVKMFELEEDLAINIIVDLSPSMKSKENFVKQLAASLAYISLINMDRLTIYGISECLHTILKTSHGKGKIFPMLNSLQDAELYGHKTDFETSMKELQLQRKRPGVCVIISDFLVADGYQSSLDLLQWSRNDVFCIQVLDPSETICSIRGDINFECTETGRQKKVTITPEIAQKYAECVQIWNDNLKKECARRNIGLIQTTTEQAFEDVVQNILRRGGLVS